MSTMEMSPILESAREIAGDDLAPYPGAFIVTEGPDGGGKTTMAKQLVDNLTDLGWDAVYTREPGGSVYAEQVRELVINEKNLNPDAQMLALFSARMDHVETVILPALMEGKIVVSDRFVDSTFAYQVACGGANEYLFNALDNHLKTILEPDLTLYFDVDHKTAVKRVGDRGTGNLYDDHFLQRFSNFNVIRQAYKERSETKPEDAVGFIDASRSQRKVSREVKKWARAIDKSHTAKGARPITTTILGFESGLRQLTNILVNK